MLDPADDDNGTDGQDFDVAVSESKVADEWASCLAEIECLAAIELKEKECCAEEEHLAAEIQSQE